MKSVSAKRKQSKKCCDSGITLGPVVGSKSGRYSSRNFSPGAEREGVYGPISRNLGDVMTKSRFAKDEALLGMDL